MYLTEFVLGKLHSALLAIVTRSRRSYDPPRGLHFYKNVRTSWIGETLKSHREGTTREVITFRG